MGNGIVIRVFNRLATSFAMDIRQGGVDSHHRVLACDTAKTTRTHTYRAPVRARSLPYHPTAARQWSAFISQPLLAAPIPDAKPLAESRTLAFRDLQKRLIRYGAQPRRSPAELTQRRIASPKYGQTRHHLGCTEN